MTLISALVIQAKDTGRFLLKKSPVETLWHFTGSFTEDNLGGIPLYNMITETQRDVGWELDHIEAFLRTGKLDYLVHAWIDSEDISPETDDEYLWADLIHFPEDVDQSVELAFKNKFFLNRILGPETS